MSAPANRNQSKVRAARQELVKVMEDIEMKSVERFSKANHWIYKNLRLIRFAKITAGVAVVGLTLAIIVSIPFGNTGASAPASNIGSGKVVSQSFESQTLSDLHPVSEEQTPNDIVIDRESPPKEEIIDFFGESVVAVLGYDVLAAKLDSAWPLTNQEIERIDAEVDLMLAAAKPATSPQLLSREVARLDDQIDMVLLNAVYQTTETNEAAQYEIKRLEQEVDAALLVASQDSSVNLQQVNHEIERLDHQIEAIREAQTQRLSETTAESTRVIEYLEQRADDLLAASRHQQ